MDSFGAGRSSLSYLRNLPFNKVNIDQSLIRDLSQDGEAAAIVRAVVALGSSLGMAVLAEGVEQKDQLSQLRDVGCDEVQGYHFSRPVPADAAAVLLAKSASN